MTSVSAEYWVAVQSAFVLELDDVDLEDDKAAIDERVQAAVLAALAGVFDDVEVAPTTAYEAGARRPCLCPLGGKVRAAARCVDCCIAAARTECAKTCAVPYNCWRRTEMREFRFSSLAV